MDTLIDLFEYKGFNIYTHVRDFDRYPSTYEVFLKFKGSTETYVYFESDSVTEILFQTKEFIDSLEGIVYDL